MAASKKSSPGEARAGRKARAPGRQSRTPYVLLGMLSIGPGSGYELRQRISTSVGYFWQESYGQLYPALRRLEREGLVRSRQVTAGRRVAARYAITARGRAALRDWLQLPPEPQPERNELLLKVFFGALAPDAARRHVASERQRVAGQSSELLALRCELSAQLAGHPHLPAYLATLDYGIATLQSVEAWCERQSVRL